MNYRASLRTLCAAAPIALTLGAPAGCKPEREGPLPVNARVTVLPGDGPVRVRVDVVTAPNAEVEVANLTIANDPVPSDSPMLFARNQRADAQGHWSGEAELSTRTGAEQIFSVNVEAEVPSRRLFSSDMRRALGRTTVAVPVPFRMYTDEAQHTLRATGAQIFYARLDNECANLSVHGLPEGATVRMNGASARAAAGVATLPYPRLERISAWRIGGPARRHEPVPTPNAPIEAAIEVQLADGSVQRGTQRLNDAIATCALNYLVTAQRGAGVPMQPEGDASMTLVIGTGYTTPTVTHVLGPAGPFSNIRAVVFTTKTRVPYGCGAYRSASGRAMGSAAERESMTLTAYDRRTGATLGRTSMLAPPPRCFASITAGGGNGLSTVPEEDVVRWASRL